MMLCTLGLGAALVALLPKNCKKSKVVQAAVVVGKLQATMTVSQASWHITLAKEDFSHCLCCSGVASANSFQCDWICVNLPGCDSGESLSDMVQESRYRHNTKIVRRSYTTTLCVRIRCL